MTLADDPTDPLDMTPEQRLEEIGGILAAAVLRLHRRGALPTTNPSGNSAQNSLDDDPRLTAHGHTS